MRPNDVFYYTSNNQLSVDYLSLTKLYLPIIGKEALALYQYLIAFWDDGQKRHSFSEILNHLDMGWQVFEKALDQLIALRLLDLYQIETSYHFVLYPNMTVQTFFTNHVYRNLLEQKIGEAAVENLIPIMVQGKKRESSVVGVLADTSVYQKNQSDHSRQADFDLTNFKQLMAREGLRFEDEKADLLVLFQIAQSQQWTWYETFLLAKETAVSHVISTKRMQQKLQAKPVKKGDFSSAEMTIIKEAQAKNCLTFLAEIKQLKRATITQTERTTLQKMASLGLLDEVINVILVLTFNKVNSANLNEKYALKVANDFAYQKIATAEQAVLRIRERNQEQKKRKTQQGSQPKKKTNVPSWSQPDFKNTTTDEEKAEMELRKKKLLAKMNQEGGA